MVSENLIGLLDELQKFTVKVKIQQILDTMVKGERVHKVIDADVVFDYYNKMHEEFAKNPHNFLFPNREWLQDSLKRLNVDVSEIFDEGANVDHIKREEIIVLFMLLWIHMKIQDPSSSSSIKTPYDLFSIWICDRVIITRPTREVYLSREDEKVLDRTSDKYGLFTNLHYFSINEKGEVIYLYTCPSNIINIDTCIKSRTESLRKIKDWAMSRLTKEQHKLAHADKKHWTEGVEIYDHRTLYPKSMFRLEVDPEELKKGTIKLGRSEKKTPPVWHHDIEEVSIKVPDHIKEQLKNGVDNFDEFQYTIQGLMDDLLNEQQRRHNIARNTKFVVREMTGYSNTSYKILLEDYYRTKFDKPIDPYIKEIVDVLAEDYGIDLDSDFISYAKKNATTKPDSQFQTVAIIDIVNAMIKLKEKLNNENA